MVGDPQHVSFCSTLLGLHGEVDPVRCGERKGDIGQQGAKRFFPPPAAKRRRGRGGEDGGEEASERARQKTED